MIFRQARPEETDMLFREGYKVWSRNRTYAQYCEENRKEDAYGTRYVLEVDGEVVSSLILLTLKDVRGIKALGIGSVLTPDQYAGNGYATKLLRECLEATGSGDTVFLYSDIRPEFYERFGFRALPVRFQRKVNSVLMVKCDDKMWRRLLECRIEETPKYF